MGADAVEPFVQAARDGGRRGAGARPHLQPRRRRRRRICAWPDGAAVWERIARAGRVRRRGRGGESGLSDVGAVIGATVPGHLARARELMPRAPFLLPGIGAQGGRVEDSRRRSPGRAGGLVTASRSIAGAHASTGGRAGWAALQRRPSACARRPGRSREQAVGALCESRGRRAAGAGRSPDGSAVR